MNLRKSSIAKIYASCIVLMVFGLILASQPMEIADVEAMPVPSEPELISECEEVEVVDACSIVGPIALEVPLSKMLPAVTTVGYAKEIVDESKALVEEITFNNTIFSDASILLNKEIYSLTASVFNEEHYARCYSHAETELAKSYIANVDPLMPLAISVCETGSWADTRYTWTPVIYSQPLLNAGVDMSSVDIKAINSETYITNGLALYLGCGANCGADTNQHYHISGGYNDCDSLGPTQILRRYVESIGVITYSCGEMTQDLMCWKDNLEYIFHVQADNFVKTTNWNRDYTIRNEYECLALMAAVHNSGSSFVSTGTADSGIGGWKSHQAVFNFAHDISNPDMLKVMQEYVNGWYETEVVCKLERDVEFALPGQCSEEVIDSLFSRAGLIKSNYATSFGHKQYYPIKAILNYMGLQKLYSEIQ